MSAQFGSRSAQRPSELIPAELTLDEESSFSSDVQSLVFSAEGGAPQSPRARPTLLLLSRRHALDGVGLLAFCSALVGPLSLEVIYAHRSLWFESDSAWQELGLSMLWRVWLLVGSVMLVGWGVNRAAAGGVAGHVALKGVEGLTYVPDPQRYYAAVVTLIGSSVYILFGVPTWYWVSQLGLKTEEPFIFRFGVSALSLVLIPQLLTFASATSKRREWILLMLGMVWVWLITRWVWNIS